jgi:hypothetical protein
LVLSDIPALLVLLAIAQRRPGGAGWARRLWNRGPMLLASGYGAHIVLLFSLNHGAFAHGFNETTFRLLSACAVDVAAMGYVLKSKLVKNIFVDFP